MIGQNGVRNRLLRAMRPSDFALLSLEPVSFALKKGLYSPGKPIADLYFVESGMASVTRDSTIGTIEVGVIGREGLVGAAPVLLGTDRSPHTCFVQMPGDAYRISSDDLLKATDQSASIRILLLRFVQCFMVQIAQTAFVNAAHTIETRLARWLLMCRDRADGDDIAVTHEFLAAMLGVRRPGVTVAVQILEGNGLIRATRGRITLFDRQGLEALAGEGYGLAEAEYDTLIGTENPDAPPSGHSI